MEKKLLLITIIVISILALPIVVANPSINNFKITSNGAQITTISTINPQTVDIEFQSDQTSGFVYLDLKELNSNLNREKVYFKDCEGSQTKNCTIKNILIKPKNKTVSIPYEINNLGQIISETLSYTFSIDDVSPRVIDLRTANCNELNNKCYVGSGKETQVIIDLEDSVGSFNKANIFFRLGSSSFKADYCEGKTCYANVSIICGNNQPLELKLTTLNSQMSRDDAGNPVSNEQDFVKRVVCDTKKPELLNLSIKGTGFLDLVTDKSQAIINISLKEMTSIATATIDASRITNNSTNFTSKCKRKEMDFQECEVIIDDLKTIKNGIFDIYLEDEVGNIQKTSHKITILRAPKNSSETNFFSVNVKEIKPKVINRAALKLAMDNALDYPYFVLYDIKQLSNGAKIVQQEMSATSCKFDFGNGTFVDDPSFFEDPITVFYPNADYNIANRLDLNFLNPEQALVRNKIKVKCNLSLYVEKDNVLYPEPEREVLEWDIRLRNAVLGEPGMAFIDKINETKKELNSGLMKLIGTANEVYSTLGHLCQLSQLALAIQDHGLNMEAMALAMPYGFGQALGQSGSATWNAAMTTSMTYWMGVSGTAKKISGETKKANDAIGNTITKDGGLGRSFCRYIHCQVNESKDATKDRPGSSWNDLGLGDKNGGKFDKLLNQATTNLNTPNVEGSLISSMMEGCLSGVVYNLNKWREIDCGYIQCLKEQASYGESISVCEEARAAKTCRFITGELFELPFVRTIKNLAANINKLIQQPLVMMANEWAASACGVNFDEYDKKFGWAGFGCHVMKTLKLQKDFSFVTQYNTLFTYPDTDLCKLALCEGKDCDQPTNSYLTKLLPGSYGVGDNYRQAIFKEKDAKIQKQNNNEIINTYNDYIKTPNDKKKKEKYKSLLTIYANNHVVEADREKFINGLEINDANKDKITEFLGKLGEGKTPSKIEEIQKLTNPIATNEADYKNMGDALSSFNEYNNDENLKANIKYDPKIKQWVIINNINKDGVAYNKMNDLVDQMNGDSGYAVCEGGAKICKGACPSAKDKDCFNKEDVITKIDDNKKLQSAKDMYGWIDQILPIFIDKLKEEGYFQKLSLSGWGDWGRDLSLKANKLLNPEEWQNSLCNPTGNFDELTESTDSVYAFQEGTFRAVLTFAGEKLTYDLEDGGQETLYTASFTAISPYIDNEVQLIFEPGKVNATDKISISKEEVVSKSASIISKKDFKSVCVLFEKEFPRSGEKKKYCKKIVLNAYDRGNVAPENTEFNFGVDDPYSFTANRGNNSNSLFPQGTAFGPGMSPR